MSFTRKSNMLKHQRKGACKGLEEITAGSDIVKAESFECSKCDKTFKYKQSYQQHMER